jgi:hypothetical protein
VCGFSIITLTTIKRDHGIRLSSGCSTCTANIGAIRLNLPLVSNKPLPIGQWTLLFDTGETRIHIRFMDKINRNKPIFSIRYYAVGVCKQYGLVDFISTYDDPMSYLATGL